MPVSLWLWFVNRNKSFINRILFFQSGIGFTYNESHVIPEEFADAAVPDIAVPFFAGCCRSGQCGNSITDELSRPVGRAVVYQLDLQQQLDAEQSILTFGIGGSSVWMLLDIDNPTGLTQFLYLLLDTPWIDEVHFHVFREGVEVERWAQPLLMIAFGSTGLVFATAFLDIRRHWRLAYRLSQGSVALVMLLYVLSLVLGSQSLALALASRIRRAQQKQYQAELDANMDSLTGLNNRRALYQRAEVFWRLSQRHQLPLSVVVLDIDHFKNFNDTYGHAFGDEVLKKLAQCMRANVREQDLAARWGGEEFILLMPNIGMEQAVAFAERLLQVLRNTPMVYQGVGVQVTASFGVAQLCPQDNNLDDLIQRADQALYRAKHEGRNRVCRHDPLLFTQPVRF